MKKNLRIIIIVIAIILVISMMIISVWVKGQSNLDTRSSAGSVEQTTESIDPAFQFNPDRLSILNVPPEILIVNEQFQFDFTVAGGNNDPERYEISIIDGPQWLAKVGKLSIEGNVRVGENPNQKLSISVTDGSTTEFYTYYFFIKDGGSE